MSQGSFSWNAMAISQPVLLMLDMNFCLNLSYSQSICIYNAYNHGIKSLTKKKTDFFAFIKWFKFYGYKTDQMGLD